MPKHLNNKLKIEPDNGFIYCERMNKWGKWEQERENGRERERQKKNIKSQIDCFGSLMNYLTC